MEGAVVNNKEGIAYSIPSAYSDERMEQNAADAIWLASLTTYFDF